jgi:hypothetical protein
VDWEWTNGLTGIKEKSQKTYHSLIYFFAGLRIPILHVRFVPGCRRSSFSVGTPPLALKTYLDHYLKPEYPTQSVGYSGFSSGLIKKIT